MADYKSAHAFRTDYKSLRTSNSTAVLAIFFSKKTSCFFRTFIRLLGSRGLQIPADKFDSALMSFICCNTLPASYNSFLVIKWHFSISKVAL